MRKSHSNRAYKCVINSLVTHISYISKNSLQECLCCACLVPWSHDFHSKLSLIFESFSFDHFVFSIKRLNLSEMQINFLPIEILLLIFDYLDFKSQLKSKNVCNLWYKLITQMFDQQKYVLIHDTHQERIQERCGNFNLIGLSYFQKQIQTISFKSFKNYNNIKTDDFTRGILRHFSQLRVIYLCLLNASDHQIYLLNWISSSCNSNLKHLTIVCRKNLRLTYREVPPFCRKFPNLKVFQFEALELTVSMFALNLLLESLTKLEVLVLNGFYS